MFEKIASIIVSYQIKFPKVFMFVFLIINLLLIPGIFNLINNVEPSLERVLPQNIDEIQTMNDMRTEFGADMIYLVLEGEDDTVDLRDLEVLRYIDILGKKILTEENVLEVQSLTTVIGIPKTIYESKNLIAENPMSLNFINHDSSISIITVRTNTGSSAKAINKIIEEINDDILSVEEYNPNIKTTITGFSAIDRATFNIIIDDFIKITVVSMIGIAIIVLLTFKSLIKGMLPMVIVMNALIWTMGIVGYLGLTITVVSMVSAAMIMGLGIDFGIHQVHSYFEERKKNNPKKSLNNVMEELLRAMFGASLTTIAGFLALLFGVLPAMKTLGIILAIGIFSTLIGAIFLLPVLIYYLDSRGEKYEN